MTMHDQLGAILGSDFLAGFFIRLVETDILDETAALAAARRLAADPDAFDDALESGYGWLAQFTQLLDDHGVI